VTRGKKWAIGKRGRLERQMGQAARFCELPELNKRTAKSLPTGGRLTLRRKEDFLSNGTRKKKKWRKTEGVTAHYRPQKSIGSGSK